MFVHFEEDSIHASCDARARERFDEFGLAAGRASFALRGAARNA